MNSEELLQNNGRDILSAVKFYSRLLAFLRQFYCSVPMGPEKIRCDVLQKLTSANPKPNEMDLPVIR